MDEYLRKLIHDLRGNLGIIIYSLNVLDSKPTEVDQNVFEPMLLRNIASAQSLLMNLVSSRWSEQAFDNSNELFFELSSLIHSLQVKRLPTSSARIKNQMDLLVDLLVSMSDLNK
ncbi:hypothetical protein [Spirosoma foliorum]|uniref:Uncharacterized protein n=1 Tax=Spirosoma foliorum TaxID=2710596 RepID=A0A7G5H6G5_9BACT|nr:hypothetical protein [Spirosoma foliorum]QMW06707.1 hypothetical protein H3H32_18345 [Spirosoma foliorum]